MCNLQGTMYDLVSVLLCFCKYQIPHKQSPFGVQTNYFQSLKIYFHALKINNQTLKMYFQALKKVLY